MSRITGTDAANLIEAYNAVYAPQEEIELTEEQVQEDFENWVNSLVEEGHDLSEYTWEDMYEEYLNEMGRTMTTGQATAPRPASSSRPAPAQNLRGLSIGPGGFRINNRPVQPGMSPIFQRPGQPAPARPAATPPSRPAATAPVSQRPAAPAPGGVVKPTVPAAAPAATTPAKPVAVTQPPESKSQASAGEIRGMIGRSMERQATSTTPQLSARAQALKAGPVRSARERMLNQDLDLFDIVKGYLIDEGYAETEQAAAVIMANMSEEWRQSIVEAVVGGSAPQMPAPIVKFVDELPNMVQNVLKGRQSSSAKPSPKKSK